MGLTILLADNSMASQNLGRRILTQAGYDVVTVSNGIAAGKKIAELHPDLALLDVYMPGYTGIEICEKTKAAPETAQIPVLLTVGKIEPFCPEEGIKVKADGVITKPFEASDLIAVVGRLTGSGDLQPAPTPAATVPKNGDSANSLAAGAAADAPVAKQPVPTLPAAPPKPSVVAAAPAPQPVRKPPKPALSSDAAATAQSPAPLFSSQGGEICDVCGCVNAEHAVVCQQCDVPLPSSLSLHKPRASHLL